MVSVPGMEPAGLWVQELMVRVYQVYQAPPLLFAAPNLNIWPEAQLPKYGPGLTQHKKYWSESLETKKTVMGAGVEGRVGNSLFRSLLFCSSLKICLFWRATVSNLLFTKRELQFRSFAHKKTSDLLEKAKSEFPTLVEERISITIDSTQND